MDTQRWIKLEQAGNFRDMGGYRNDEGRTIRWRRLFRSDQLGRLSEDDIRVVRDELGVRTVIDLRSAEEVAGHGVAVCVDGAEVRHVHISLNRPRVEGDPDPLMDLRDLGELYLWKLRGEGESLAAVLRLLADAETCPAVFHCMGGKDRTGIVAAVVLSLCGVPDDVIVSDYALTERARERTMTAERESEVRKLLAEQNLPWEILFAPPEAMARFLEGVREAHGSVRQMVRDIGVEDPVVESLRGHLLEG